jgi:DNA-binding transcriptional LysR family regulator
MNLSLRQIRYVTEVARQGSIQKASQTLHISQSSILAAITLAENALDAKIFDRRQARGVLVTQEGERFLTIAQSLLEAEAEFSRSLGTMGHSTPENIRVGCFIPFGPAYMIDIFKEYRQQNNVGTIDLLEGSQPQLREWLARGEIEFAVTVDVGHTFAGSSTIICELPTHAALPPDHPLAMRNSVSLAELVDYPFILLDLPETSVYLLTLFDMIARRPRVALRTTSYETVRTAIAGGLGFSLLNTISNNNFTSDRHRIARVALSDKVPSPKVVVVDLYGSHKPAHLKNFIATLKNHLNQRPKIGSACENLVNCPIKADHTRP